MMDQTGISMTRPGPPSARDANHHLNQRGAVSPEFQWKNRGRTCHGWYQAMNRRPSPAPKPRVGYATCENVYLELATHTTTSNTVTTAPDHLIADLNRRRFTMSSNPGSAAC